jgi:hypothetical protein
VTVTPADEGPHPPGPELRWAESWLFDFWSLGSPGGPPLGGWCRLTLVPSAGVVWYHAFLAGTGRQLVAVIDTEVPPPGPSLEIRTTGLWATHICETPHDHWTVGLEAFALGVDDPAEIYGRQFGDRVPLGFDLEWEGDGPVVDGGGSASGYDQTCRVSGEVLVGPEVIDLDGLGRRERRWGPATAWDARWFRFHGTLDDRTEVSATVEDGDLASAAGSLGGVPVEVVEISEALGAGARPERARAVLGDVEIDIEPQAVTPVELIDVENRSTRCPRALCRFTAGDGRAGAGWAEWNLPQR